MLLVNVCRSKFTDGRSENINGDKTLKYNLKKYYRGYLMENNNNNTYVLKDINSNKIKGTYNQLSIKKYVEER